MVITLRGLQSSANHKNTSAPLTWRAINALGQNDGAPDIDFERFSAQWDQEDESGILHQLVDRFDETGLVLKTHYQDQDKIVSKGKEGAVSKMAKHALRKK